MLNFTSVLAVILCVAPLSQPILAQVAPPVILQIDTANRVQYYEDTADPTKFATNPSITTAVPPANFGPLITLADIVAVNGQPVKGLFYNNSRTLTLRPAPTPGQAIADTTRSSVENHSYEILNNDGSQIGTIIAVGNGAGPPPPGVPLAATAGDNVIVGGTGAFLGARGYVGSITLASALPTRLASITEDPANRRQHGGGTLRFIMYLIPMTRPEVITTSGGPAVTHSNDFTLVTASKPASAGEILSLFATGLGPTRPGVDPGQPFPSSPLAAVNSPLDVKVNGESTSVLAAIGYPGAVDGYQINFQVPADAAKGVATVQVSAAWIAGSPVNIQIH